MLVACTKFNALKSCNALCLPSHGKVQQLQCTALLVQAVLVIILHALHVQGISQLSTMSRYGSRGNCVIKFVMS